MIDYETPMESGPFPAQEASKFDHQSPGGRIIRGALDAAPQDRLRVVLRKLRDVDLRGERVALDGDRSVLIGGCLSLDQPAEHLLRYRLVSDRDEQESLEVALTDDGFHLERRGCHRQLLHESHLRFEGGRIGGIISSELSCRIDPEEAGAREIEHVLRRMVRVACA